jgi:hypothetical protein
MAAWIAAGAAIVGILVTVGLSYVQDQTAKTEVAHNRMIKDGISRYIKLGDAIMNDFAQNKWPVVEENDWTGDVKGFLQANHLDSYVSRFEDSSGIPPVTIRPGADTQHDNEYVYMHHRITRLEEFSQELP